MKRTVAAFAVLALAGCVGAPAWHDSSENSNPPQLLVMVGETGPARFQPGAAEPAGYSGTPLRARSRRLARAVAQDHGLLISDDWPMPALGVRCFVMSVPKPLSLETILSALQADERVESAQALQRFEVSGYDDPYVPLQTSVRTLRLEEVHRVATGKGVKVALVDTGVDWRHPDLSGRIASYRNFVDGSPYRAEVHGTAVAGIIVAQGNNGVGMVGVAPGATLLALRACWAQTPNAQPAVCNTFTLAKALQHALNERAQVINLSVTGPPDRLLERLLAVGARRGVVLVGAAEGKDPGFPAGDPDVIAVTAEPHLGPASALVAPGTRILSTAPGNAWGYFSGASFATAHVSGIAAILLERVPGLTPRAIRQALAASTGDDPLAAIDPCAALTQVAGAPACPCCPTASALARPRASLH